jgi:excinuclease ABC subunit C
VTDQRPQRGEKRDLVDHALANAKRGARPQAGRNLLAGAALQGYGGGASTYRACRGAIEVYDNSHIMGTNAVGG